MTTAREKFTSYFKHLDQHPVGVFVALTTLSLVSVAGGYRLARNNVKLLVPKIQGFGEVKKFESFGKKL